MGVEEMFERLEQLVGGGQLEDYGPNQGEVEVRSIGEAMLPVSSLENKVVSTSALSLGTGNGEIDVNARLVVFDPPRHAHVPAHAHGEAGEGEEVPAPPRGRHHKKTKGKKASKRHPSFGPDARDTAAARTAEAAAEAEAMAAMAAEASAAAADTAAAASTGGQGEPSSPRHAPAPTSAPATPVDDTRRASVVQDSAAKAERGAEKALELERLRCQQLEGRVEELRAELATSSQALTELYRVYQPVLASIEGRLLQMKRQGAAAGA
mmetsp:Transcript_11576/g.36646  ORF Transcript_11576/g.36646 Transcript_11576/m.36646 type:complete len:266 (-) Transcript_11576:155-952(-)